MQLDLFNQTQRLLRQDASIKELDNFSLQSIDKHKNTMEKWQQNIKDAKADIKIHQFLVKSFYKKMNKEAHID